MVIRNQQVAGSSPIAGSIKSTTYSHDPNATSPNRWHIGGKSHRLGRGSGTAVRGALDRSGHNRQVPEERKNASEDRLRRRMEMSSVRSVRVGNTDLIVAKDAGRVQGAALNLRVHGSIP